MHSNYLAFPIRRHRFKILNYFHWNFVAFHYYLTVVKSYCECIPELVFTRYKKKLSVEFHFGASVHFCFKN